MGRPSRIWRTGNPIIDIVLVCVPDHVVGNYQVQIGGGNGGGGIRIRLLRLVGPRAKEGSQGVKGGGGDRGEKTEEPQKVQE